MEQLKSRDALESVLRSLQEELTECKDAILDGQILDDDGFMRKGTAEQLQMARDDINSDEMELLKLKTEKADADTSIVNLGWDLQKPYYRDKLDTMLRELGLTVDVFFISNEHYMVCKGVKPVKGGLLELARTGIPDLRRHVLEMTAVDEMATMQEYIAEVETFLRGVSVVVNPEHLKQNREVLLTIERVKGRISDLKHQKYFAALDEAIEENLERSIRRRMDTLATKAAGLAHEKVTWHPSTPKAFISHAGRWKTKKVGSQDWNRAFFAKFVKVILANWDAFETAEADAFTSLQTALSSEIRGVIADANKRGAEKRLGDKTGEFRALIEAKIEAADRFCDKAKREYAIKLGANKTEATKPGIGAQQSYIDTAMNDVYELCKLVIGKGYRRKVVDMLAEHVEAKGNRSPFMSVVFDLKDAIEGDANAQLDPLIEAVEGIFDDITGWLEGVFAEKAGDTIAPAIRKKLAGYLPGALQTIRDVKSQLDKIVGEYDSMI